MQTLSTPNGTVFFFDSAIEAGRQAEKDARGDALATASRRRRVRAPGAPQILPVIGALASAAASFANLGVSLARAAQSDESPFLQVSFLNFGSMPVVVYDYAADTALVARVPPPILPGDTDVAVLVPSTSGAFEAKTELRLDFLVGPPASAASPLPDPISCSARIQFSSTVGRWKMDLSIDGSDMHPFTSDARLMGATFTPSAGQGAFSIYWLPVQGAETEIDIAIYDLVSA